MKTLLLLDINSTLDRNLEEGDIVNANPSWEGVRLGIGPLRHDFDVFKNFIQDYQHQVHVIFLTAVGLSGQNYMAQKLQLQRYHLLDNDLIMYSKEFVGPFRDRGEGICGDKYRTIPAILEHFNHKIEKLIWFEDHVSGKTKESIEKNKQIFHVGIGPNDKMQDKVNQIQSIINHNIQ